MWNFGFVTCSASGSRLTTAASSARVRTTTSTSMPASRCSAARMRFDAAASPSLVS